MKRPMESSLVCLLILGHLVSFPPQVACASPPEDGETLVVEPEVTEDDRDHWSLRPLTRPTLPDVKNTTVLANAIDYFVAAQLEEVGLEHSSLASPASLARRLKYDLHGLPPTLSDVRQLEDRFPESVSDYIEQLLSDMAFGEHAAQAWLDLARFAETDGFEHDKVRKGAWRYRDWVINAMNEDMPYDEFVRQQLAGDLLPNSKQGAVSTMFCMCGPDMPDINEQDLRRHDKLNELTGTVGAVFLGLQFQCAQCHDHKYDPISQLDFYRLRAVFESSVPLMKRDRHVLSLAEQSDPETAKFYHRGDLSGAGKAVEPGIPRLALPAEKDHRLESTRARLLFASWLCSPDNPLTARVIVNRIWQQHFGRSLSENPSDLGVVAGSPTHPQLLDWLASELVSADWSLKHIHRLILNSRTYQQAGKNESQDLAFRVKKDPDFQRYAFYPGRRLSGEEIRDSMLSISGLLERERGGPGVFPPLPPELRSTLLKNQWSAQKHEKDAYRRSIYTFARRNLRYPIFDAFDRPDAGASCAVRNKSTTATQSLYLLNSPFTLECAQKCATIVVNNSNGKIEREVDSLIELIYGRPADEAEREELLAILRTPENLAASLVTAAVALFNTNEFLYVD